MKVLILVRIWLQLYLTSKVPSRSISETSSSLASFCCGCGAAAALGGAEGRLDLDLVEDPGFVVWTALVKFSLLGDQRMFEMDF